MHSNSDFEVTSLAASSPPRSPRRSAYYVQSPSRDSHDGDSKVSYKSTPQSSPIGSPHNQIYSSRDSSQNLENPLRGTNSLRRVLPLPSNGSHSHQGTKPWANCDVIEEEPEAEGSNKSSPIYMAILVLLACVIFLVLFILFFWLVCKPQYPRVSVKNITFRNLFIGDGMDASGVPTEMVTLNCTVHLTLYNPSKYFKVHVTLIDASLDYSELTIAKGQISSFDQAKRTKKTVSVVVQAVEVPIYGADNEISVVANNATSEISVEMVATIRSQYSIVGKIVKPKFRTQATCNLVVNLDNMNLQNPLRNSCIYSSHS